MTTMTVNPTSDDEDERLIDAEEVARRLDVSRYTVWVMVRDGRLFAPIELGMLKRWRVRDLNRWVEERATKISKIEAASTKAAKKSRRD